jgi:hypothetical protein
VDFARSKNVGFDNSIKLIERRQANGVSRGRRCSVLQKKPLPCAARQQMPPVLQVWQQQFHQFSVIPRDLLCPRHNRHCIWFQADLCVSRAVRNRVRFPGPGDLLLTEVAISPELFQLISESGLLFECPSFSLGVRDRVRFRIES